MLLHLTWSKMSYNEYKEKMQLKVTKLEETIANLENDKTINNLSSTKRNSDHGEFYYYYYFTRFILIFNIYIVFTYRIA